MSGEVIEAGVDISVFKLYSIGTAAENIEFGKTELEIWPSEQLSSVDGDITTNQTNISSEGENADGGKYTQNINAGNSLKAKWLSRNAQRPFPGLVRRGEKVMVWRNADTSEWWWEEMGDDIRYRRGDIMTMACVSTIVNKDDPLSPLNSYWFEIDSLNGVIRLSTTKLNNEACNYLFEFMTREGTFRLQDSLGNYLKLESNDLRWTLTNGADTTLVMDAENTTLSMTGKFTVNAANLDFNIGEAINVNAETKTENIRSQFSLNAVTATMTATANYSINSPTIGLNGALSSAGYGGGSGSANFSGTMDIEGATTIAGETTIVGELTNNGINVTSHNHNGDSGGDTGPMK